jgi:hypothetical protein
MDDSGGFGAPPPPPPPGDGCGGSIPQRGLGDILSVAIEVYKANAAKLIQIVAVLVIPLTFVLALLTQVAFKQHCDKTSTLSECVSGLGHSLLIRAIGWFIAIAIQQLLLGALTRGAAGALIGRDVDVSASYQYAFSRLGPLIGLAILIALVVGIGFFLLFVPGIIVLVFLAVSVPAFIIEGLGVTDSMSRSWKLVSGSWWHVFGVILVASSKVDVEDDRHEGDERRGDDLGDRGEDPDTEERVTSDRREDRVDQTGDDRRHEDHAEDVPPGAAHQLPGS